MRTNVETTVPLRHLALATSVAAVLVASPGDAAAAIDFKAFKTFLDALMIGARYIGGFAGFALAGSLAVGEPGPLRKSLVVLLAACIAAQAPALSEGIFDLY